MRRFTTYMTAFVAALALAVTAMAQVRGTGRLGGQVLDKASGKPIANATVTCSLPNGSTQPIVTNTDKNGRWSALGTSTSRRRAIRRPAARPTSARSSASRRSRPRWSRT